jgi:hypothetical protein
VDGAPRADFGLAFVLIAIAAVGEAFALFAEAVLGAECGLGGGGEVVEPVGVCAVDAVVVEDEVTFVRVERDRDFGDVAVVDAVAGDALALGPLAEMPRVFGDAVREHLDDGRHG